MTRRDLLTRSAAGAVLLGTGALPEALAEAARLPDTQVRALRAAVRGAVLVPGDAGYDAARLVFNRRWDAIRPPAVVRVRDAADVQAVVRWAERFDVALVARSGGNAYHGASTSRDAVVVDLGALRGIRLGGRTVTAGPAVRNIDLYTRLAPRGVTVPSGSCPNIAVGGLALGGGMGLAGRAMGLTLDRISSLDAVTADGRLRRVDAHSEPDLFWALRGGGGSFAIVTSVRLRAAPLPRASFFRATFRRASREEALAAFDALGPGAPDALTAICTLTAAGATVFGQYVGPEASLRPLVAHLGRIPGARLTTGTSGYLALQRRWAGCGEGESVAACRAVPRSTFDASSIYVARGLSAAGRRAFLAAADAGATLICDAYGGAIGRVAPDATAFVHRRVRFSVQILSYAPIATARSRVGRARRLIAPFGNGQAYQNYADPALSGPLAAYYGANLGRLRRIKRDVDPADRFRVEQGIRPASGPSRDVRLERSPVGAGPAGTHDRCNAGGIARSEDDGAR